MPLVSLTLPVDFKRRKTSAPSHTALGDENSSESQVGAHRMAKPQGGGSLLEAEPKSSQPGFSDLLLRARSHVGEDSQTTNAA